MAGLIRREQGSSLGRRTFDPFEMMREMLSGGFEPFRELARGPEGMLGFTPSFDVKETKDTYVFKADLPGLKENDIDISVTGNRLTISGKREEETRDESERYYAYERSYGTFSRSFTLPEGVDPNNVHADLKDGVLTVLVPKKPEVQPRRIEVKASSAAGEQKKVKA